MTSSSNIAAKFEAAIEAFTPISGQPMNDDLQGVQKVLLQTCLLIRLAGSTAVKVTGLVLPNAAYKNKPGVTALFDDDDTPLYKYDPAVTKETKAWEQRKLQALWNTHLDNQVHIRTTKHGCRLFILHTFEEVHYIYLRDKDTYYKMVSPLELLTHFAKKSGASKLPRSSTSSTNSWLLVQQPLHPPVYHDDGGSA